MLGGGKKLINVYIEKLERNKILLRKRMCENRKPKKKNENSNQVGGRDKTVNCKYDRDHTNKAKANSSMIISMIYMILSEICEL